MQSLMDMVACVKVTSQDSAEVFANQFFDYGPAAGMMVLVVAYGWGRSCPDVGIESVFSPSRLIHLDSRTRSDLRFQLIQKRLHVFFQAMVQLNNLSVADRDSMQGTQVQVDLTNRQTHHHAQGRNQTGQSDSDAPLTHDLFLHIHRSFTPFLTASTPTFVDIMMRDLKGCRRWNIDDLSHTGKADASQTQITFWTVHHTVFDDLCWSGSGPSPIVLRLT